MGAREDPLLSEKAGWGLTKGFMRAAPDIYKYDYGPTIFLDKKGTGTVLSRGENVRIIAVGVSHWKKSTLLMQRISGRLSER
jgi:hypothetical protein